MSNEIGDSRVLHQGIGQITTGKSNPEKRASTEAPAGQSKGDTYVPQKEYIDCSDLMKDAGIDHHRRRVSDFVWKAHEPIVTEFEVAGQEKKQQGDPYKIDIVHTNDLHGNLDPNHGKGGMAYVAGKIGEIRGDSAHSMLIDVGDIAYAPPYSDRNRFNPMPSIMNKIGYDAMAAGNHEFQWEAGRHGGPDGNPNPSLTDNSRELTEHLDFPLLCANAVRDDGRPSPMKSYVIKKVGDVNVGVVGLVTSKMATNAHPDVADGWKILDQAQVLNKLIPEMKKEGADIIVVASHDSLGRNQEMIQRTHGVDVVLGGHDHETTDKPISVRNADGREVPLVEAGAHGYLVGRLQLEVDPASKKIARVTSTLYPVESDKIKPDPAVKNIVDTWLRKSPEQVSSGNEGNRRH